MYVKSDYAGATDLTFHAASAILVLQDCGRGCTPHRQSVVATFAAPRYAELALFVIFQKRPRFAVAVFPRPSRWFLFVAPVVLLNTPQSSFSRAARQTHLRIHLPINRSRSQHCRLVGRT
ncbi:hypothetical protein SBA6_40057 [Candidatus Sulfopaludibacter sp. SbA6]|nr:hypothetical protein SBA6_40057 [Candidatus Sulfopaludibacter sp. SbA6]